MNIHDKAEDRKSGKRYFEIFMGLFDRMDDDQVLLIIELLKNYSIYQPDSYLRMLEDAYSDVFQTATINPQHIYYLPVATQLDLKKNKQKSGHSLLSLTSAVGLVRVAPCLVRKQSTMIPNYMLRGSKYNNRSIYIFLDDFVGTGDQASRAVQEFCDYTSVNISDVYILSLVTMAHGWEHLVDANINIGTSRIAYKGISSRTMSKQQNAIDLITMSTIEQMISVPRGYRWGYGRSQGLVTMIRTPNNTFPFFWYDCHAKREVPFPRAT
ncbi:phosphoribosyltransferase-like protein [Humidesulfovibrio sp.]